MLKENEVVMLVLGMGVMFLMILNIVHIKKIKSWKLLLAGYCILLAGWSFTVLEGFFLESYFNYFEHVSYAVSALALIVWGWKISARPNEEDIK